MSGRQCYRLLQWRPQVFGFSAAAAQECTDGPQTDVGFLVSRINPDGLLVALDGEFYSAAMAYVLPRQVYAFA